MGQIRIIGGRYGGRRLPVAVAPGLRPTTDRVRETLFNWLQPVITGARCLDLFAGTGALGLEAASRGAGEVVLVERSLRLARQLVANVATLNAEQVSVVTMDALRWLAGEARAFDIVFVDPPFDSDLAVHSMDALGRGWLAPRALVYLERPARLEPLALPEDWRYAKDKRAGDVRFALIEANRPDER